MKKGRTVFVLIMMLFLTLGYSLFIKTGAQFVSVLISESNPNPGWLYNLTARGTIVWILFAWVSFFVNALWIIKAFQKNFDAQVYVPAALVHGLWVLMSLSWNLYGFMAPFVLKAHILQ